MAAFLLTGCGGGGGGGADAVSGGSDGGPIGGSTPAEKAAPATPAAPVTFKVLSNRAELLSGGDALVEAVPAAGNEGTKLVFELNGTDVSASFGVRSGGRWAGLVQGLRDGPNLLVAKSPDGGRAEITLVNHPISGAILYGPQVNPWACDPGASDPACNRPISYSFKYLSTDPAKTGFLPYDPARPATDVATTTTDAGTSVPFIVRVETGVQDRDYYNVAVLFDPARPWTPWAPQDAWNRKLLILHGSGCGQDYAQTNVKSADRVLDRQGLARGFAVLTVSLNDSSHNCNIAVQAEANMMAKEHVIEAYGELRYTFGYGSSGGALAQQWVANAYPGIYDGIIVGSSFPDAGSAMMEIEDCALLKNYFAATTVGWTDEQKAAASGHVSTGVCDEWIDLYKYNRVLDPNCTVDGLRCDLWDLASSIFGKDSAGRALRPWSNVGVQYGLAALEAGRISAAQFVDLNARIGSHDLDYKLQSSRIGVDAKTAASAYRSGFMNYGNGLATIPILDLRGVDTAGIHHQFRSWAMRARLDRAQGGHGNQAIWYASGTPAEAYSVMDAWLSALKADTSDTPQAQKVIKHRPAAANDRCFDKDGMGLTMEQCTGAADASVRMGAGGPVTDDIVDCALKPLDRASYRVSFTDAQWARMQAAFPSGVCDFSKAGNGQQPAQFWQTYLDANGNVIVGGRPL